MEGLLPWPLPTFPPQQSLMWPRPSSCREHQLTVSPLQPPSRSQAALHLLVSESPRVLSAGASPQAPQEHTHHSCDTLTGRITDWSSTSCQVSLLLPPDSQTQSLRVSFVH